MIKCAPFCLSSSGKEGEDSEEEGEKSLLKVILLRVYSWVKCEPGQPASREFEFIPEYLISDPPDCTPEYSINSPYIWFQNLDRSIRTQEPAA